MEAYEKIFAKMEELKMSQSELSRRTGIPVTTINDWKMRKNNPKADRLWIVAEALNMTVSELVCDGGEADRQPTVDYSTDEKHLIELYRSIDQSDARKLVRYLEYIVRLGKIPEVD